MDMIALNNVHVHFPIYGMNARSLKKKILQVTLGGKIQCDAHNKINVHALKNLTLTIKEGDRVGLLGANGAGKSTLLRVLAGIYEPSMGEVNINGGVSALFDVMLGLNPEASGYENITLSGILHGLTFGQIAQKKSEIAHFTELGDYLNMPIRSYSNGMCLRLAFAIATAIEPEILIIDEVVGAGDAHFIHKAQVRMEGLIHAAKAVVLASHDNHIIETLCNKVMVLDKGQLCFFGGVVEGLDFYRDLVY